MRVIAGTAKGRPLKAVSGIGTRPTTDKVKEAIFSMIGPYFTSGRGLDLYAGTGGLGIEALSRGLEHVIFIDLASASIQIIQDNLRVVGFADQAEVYRNDSLRALKLLQRRKLSFDLVFLDPPYNMKSVEDILRQMQLMDLLNDEATIVAEHEASHEYAEAFADFTRRKHNHYGDTAVSIYIFNKKPLSGGEYIGNNRA